MKLDYDLLRETLMIVEKKKNLRDFLDLDDIYVDLDTEKYTLDDLAYTLLKANEAELILAEPIKGLELKSFLIGHLTYKGHEFLNSIADETVWKETKQKISKFKAVTLPVIQQLAANIISKQLNLS